MEPSQGFILADKDQTCTAFYKGDLWSHIQFLVHGTLNSMESILGSAQREQDILGASSDAAKSDLIQTLQSAIRSLILGRSNLV